MKLPLHYRLNRKIVGLIGWIMDRFTVRSSDSPVDLRPGRIRKILLVRANFRLGDAILASAAVALVRRRFARAQIAFVGWSATGSLFERLPITRYYAITRRFPRVVWLYPALIRRLRSRCYDLALDVSCSRSALGAFIVGLSGARWRAGIGKKYDRWLNVRLPCPRQRNKYAALPELLSSIGLPAREAIPHPDLSDAEHEEGRRILAPTRGAGPLVGVFVGGRLSVGKRWPADRFRALVAGLRARGASVAIFVGPEEKRLADEFNYVAGASFPVFLEPKLRRFAAMVASCDLFVAGDSGPMHLACAVGTRTVAIFQNHNFARWAPPAAQARVVEDSDGVDAGRVLAACIEELSVRFPEFTLEPREADVAPEVDPAPAADSERERTGLLRVWPDLFFAPGLAQAVFFIALASYSCFAPPSFIEETWLDIFVDAFGLVSLCAGGLLRVWSLSHAEKCPLWLQAKPARLITEGPYGYLRHPMYVGNFLVSVGLVFLADAYILLPLLVGLTLFQHRVIVAAEDRFLYARFGRTFAAYRAAVPAYMPRVAPRPADFSLRRDFQLRAFTHVWGIVLAASFFEWIESPAHREWLRAIVHGLVG